MALRHRAGLFAVKEIPIEIVMPTGDIANARGAMITESELRNRLQLIVRSIEGKAIWDIDLATLRASLGRDEWVQDVLISRAFPSDIKVRVRPKTAVLVLISGKEEFFPVTADGQLLKALPPGQIPDAPLLRGQAFIDGPEKIESLKKREEAVHLITSLNDRGLLASRNVSEVSWSATDGYTLTLVQPKVDVKLGDDHIDVRAMRVAQVLNYLAVNNLKGRVIDASFSKKVLVRLRKGP